MEEKLLLYTDRLNSGKSEEISCELPPSFLAVEEKELHFMAPIKLEGEAYIAEDSLVIHLKIETEARMPCSICNEETVLAITLPSFYHVEQLEDIRSRVFDYSPLVREGILLELPLMIECDGSCPKREELEKYLKSEPTKVKDEVQYPFEDL